jgi:hypothetical protein
VYDTVFDPATEICAGDYDQRTDTMVNLFIYLFFSIENKKYYSRMEILVVLYSCVNLMVVGLFLVSHPMVQQSHPILLRAFMLNFHPINHGLNPIQNLINFKLKLIVVVFF